MSNTWSGQALEGRASPSSSSSNNIHDGNNIDIINNDTTVMQTIPTTTETTTMTTLVPQPPPKQQQQQQPLKHHQVHQQQEQQQRRQQELVAFCELLGPLWYPRGRFLRRGLGLQGILRRFSEAFLCPCVCLRCSLWRLLWALQGVEMDAIANEVVNVSCLHFLFCPKGFQDNFLGSSEGPTAVLEALLGYG